MTLYVSDLDGTLLNNAAVLDAQSTDVLNALLDAGVAFTFATARSFSSAGRITEKLRLHLPVITYNGAVVCDPVKGCGISYATLDKTMLAPLMARLRQARIAPLVYAMLDGEEKCSWISGEETDGIGRYIQTRKGNGRMRPVQNDAALMQGDIYYLALIGTPDETAPAKAILEKEPGLCTHLQPDTYFPQDHWLEIFRADVNKAAAVTALKAAVKADRLVTFGDNLNDISMFLASDACYAVQNAREELKEMATGVIPSNEMAGVVQWLCANASL